MRICLKIGYDGTNYNGWQSGGTGIDISTTLTNAIKKLLDEDIKVIAASRTDAGVHANENVVIFDTNRTVNPDKLFFAINNLLPNDIVVKSSKMVADSFNPRKCDTIKTYLYKIHNARVRDPLKNRYSHYVFYDIDIKKMIKASKFLIGTHDFRSFANPRSQVIENGGKTIRTIKSIKILKKDDMIETYVQGEGFLYNMVRIIVGTLLKIGMNMWDVEYIKEILALKDRKYAGFTLPACGLTLINIKFT